MSYSSDLALFNISVWICVVMHPGPWNCFTAQETSLQVFDCTSSHNEGTWTDSTCWISLKLLVTKASCQSSCLDHDGEISRTGIPISWHTSITIWRIIPGRIPSLIGAVCTSNLFANVWTAKGSLLLFSSYTHVKIVIQSNYCYNPRW